MLDVTVKRSEWGRGTFLGSLLYNPQTRKRCCLGFVGNACGITDKQMSGIESPASLYAKSNLIILDSLLGSITKFYNSNICNELMSINELILDNDDKSYFKNSTTCNTLMSINDDTSYFSDEYRESQLTKFGKEAGINFTFVD